MKDIVLKAVAYCTISDTAKSSVEVLKEHYYQLMKEKGYGVAEVGTYHRQNGTTELIQGIYADEGSAGLGIEGHPALGQLIKDAQERNFDIMFINDINMIENQELTQVLKDIYKLGIYVFIESTEDTPIHQSKDHDLLLTINDYLAQTHQQNPRV